MEHLLVVVEFASLRHDLGSIHRHLVLLVHLDLRIDVLAVHPLVRKLTLIDALRSLFIVVLILNLLLKASDIESTVKALAFRDEAWQRAVVLLKVDKRVLGGRCAAESGGRHEL